MSSSDNENTRKIFVIIPAFNEGLSISHVIKDIPAFVKEIIVVDNGSTDDTVKQARNAGAVILSEPKSGYGYACLKGINYLRSQADSNDIIVFLDGDYSDFPQEMTELIEPIFQRDYDLVIGSRVLGKREKGALMIHQRLGNLIATTLIHYIFKKRFTDLGPFRAIRWDKLVLLNMQDQTFGWTVEMQVKAAKGNLKYIEIPVSYKKRIGKSKVSGTAYGTIMAGYKILYTIFKNI